MKISTRLIGRPLATLAAAILVTTGGAAAYAASHPGTYVPGLGISVPAAKLNVLKHTIPHLFKAAAPQPIRPGSFITTPIAHIPATIVPAQSQIPVSPTTLTFTGGWMTSNGRSLVGVYAGYNPADPTQGRVVILRQHISRGTQTETVLNLTGSGSLTIASAPTGSAAETTAQHGTITLRTAAGATVILNLATSKIG